MKSYKSGDKIAFGKHKGLTIDRVSQLDPSYMWWLYKSRIIDEKTITRHNRGELNKNPLPKGKAQVWYYK